MVKMNIPFHRGNIFTGPTCEPCVCVRVLFTPHHSKLDMIPLVSVKITQHFTCLHKQDVTTWRSIKAISLYLFFPYLYNYNKLQQMLQLPVPFINIHSKREKKSLLVRLSKAIFTEPVEKTKTKETTFIEFIGRSIYTRAQRWCVSLL